MSHQYIDISHFRAPYKDSDFSGFGVYEPGAHGDGLHAFGTTPPAPRVLMPGAHEVTTPAPSSDGMQAMAQAIAQMMRAAAPLAALADRHPPPYSTAEVGQALPGMSSADVADATKWLNGLSPADRARFIAEEKQAGGTTSQLLPGPGGGVTPRPGTAVHDRAELTPHARTSPPPWARAVAQRVAASLGPTSPLHRAVTVSNKLSYFVPASATAIKAAIGKGPLKIAKEGPSEIVLLVGVGDQASSQAAAKVLAAWGQSAAVIGHKSLLVSGPGARVFHVIRNDADRVARRVRPGGAFAIVSAPADLVRAAELAALRLGEPRPPGSRPSPLGYVGLGDPMVPGIDLKGPVAYLAADDSGAFFGNLAAMRVGPVTTTTGAETLETAALNPPGVADQLEPALTYIGRKAREGNYVLAPRAVDNALTGQQLVATPDDATVAEYAALDGGYMVVKDPELSGPPAPVTQAGMDPNTTTLMVVGGVVLVGAIWWFSTQKR